MYQQVNRPARGFIHKFTLFAGVILPIIAITFEFNTHTATAVFFDPIPTAWHLMLVLFVPLAQLQVWFAIRRGAPDRLKLAGFVNAAAIGISIFYSLLCLPFLPLAILTVLILVGLLPLAPALSLLAALLMRKQLRRVAAIAPGKTFSITLAGLLAALGATILMIGFIELPAALTRYGLHMAVSDSAETRSEGIRFLRSYGNKQYLLRSCYSQSGHAADLPGDIFWLQEPITAPQAREIYYRVTGETHDMSPPPQGIQDDGLPPDTYDFETDQDGTRTARKIKGLSLFSSEITGSIDADGGVGSLDWTLIFKNDSDFPQEARAEVRLPPGGVVSRLTFSGNYAENEISFTNRNQHEAERERRQEYYPVQVMTAGRDRVLVSVVIRPKSHETKIRMGITVPLVLERKDQARLPFPYLAGRNFSIPDKVRHSVWIEATRPLNTDYAVLNYFQRRSDNFVVWGKISDKKLAQPENALRLSRADSDSGVWSRNTFEPGGNIVRQSIVERTPAHLHRIVVVVDTSASMAQWEHDINAALGVLPRDLDVKLVLARSDWLHESWGKDFLVNGIEEASRVLAGIDFIGGADNVPALKLAWDLAAERPGNNAIVWIHTPQLTRLEPVEELRRRWERGPFGPSLYSVQTSRGSDIIEKKLDGINEVKSTVRLGTLRSDLERLFRQLSGQIKTFEFVRSTAQRDLPAQPAGHETSEHLARLWANDEVARILNAHDNTLNDAAGMLAVRYQLVTPVSGLGPPDHSGDSFTLSVCGNSLQNRGRAAVVLIIPAFLIVAFVFFKILRKHGGGCVV